jgi:hypothetical protein
MSVAMINCGMLRLVDEVLSEGSTSLSLQSPDRMVSPEPFLTVRPVQPLAPASEPRIRLRATGSNLGLWATFRPAQTTDDDSPGNHGLRLVAVSFHRDAA